MSHEQTDDLRNGLAARLGPEALAAEWPVEFQLEPGGWGAVFDPRNAMLILQGMNAEDLAAPDLAWCAAAGALDGALCSRLMVVARAADGAEWRQLGFAHEGTLPGYWEQGGAAELWCRTSPARARSAAPLPSPSAANSRPNQPRPAKPRRTTPLPDHWICRPALPDDADAITALLKSAFPGYAVPDDPGSVRYALAIGAVHGRVVCDDAARIQAYAGIEIQPSGGAAEVTDCATNPAHRGRGLMRHLVAALQADQLEVFGSRHLFAFARENQPAIAAVLAGLGWRSTGRLLGHYRLDGRWVAAGVWAGLSPGG